MGVPGRGGGGGRSNFCGGLHPLGRRGRRGTRARDPAQPEARRYTPGGPRPGPARRSRQHRGVRRLPVTVLPKVRRGRTPDDRTDIHPPRAGQAGGEAHRNPGRRVGVGRPGGGVRQRAGPLLGLPRHPVCQPEERAASADSGRPEAVRRRRGPER